MTQAVTHLQEAIQRAITIRPKVGGFPYLAETLRAAGVTRNFWTLPACESLYLTKLGPVVMQGTPLFTGAADQDGVIPGQGSVTMKAADGDVVWSLQISRAISFRISRACNALRVSLAKVGSWSQLIHSVSQPT